MRESSRNAKLSKLFFGTVLIRENRERSTDLMKTEMILGWSFELIFLKNGSECNGFFDWYPTMVASEEKWVFF